MKGNVLPMRRQVLWTGKPLNSATAEGGPLELMVKTLSS